MVRFLATAGGMTTAQIDQFVRDAIAPVRQMAQDAETRAEAAETLGQQAHDAIPTIATQAQAAATKADAIDVKRSEYEAALAASVNDRAAIHAALDALAARITALEAAKVTVAYGNATITGSLLAGATISVVVTLSRNMGTGYSIGYGLAGGNSLLGSLVIAGVTSSTPTTVTLTVRNTGLTALASLAGAVVHVVAAKEG